LESFIEIRGARENNLKDVSLRAPKRKITIFTGVSGSGKSSICVRDDQGRTLTSRYVAPRNA
jgi:excinuclease UvrABC ATPase subunit